MKGSRPLSDEEIKLVLNGFAGKYGVRDRCLFVCGIKTGFRISELLSLRIKDVRHRGQILDTVSVQKRNMKAKVEGRTIKLNPEAQAAIRAWVDALEAKGQDDPESFLFQSRKGENRPISKVQAYRILQSAFDAYGLTGRLGTHAMRKTFADRIYTALGENLFKTQQALGHRKIDSTIHYLSFRQSEIDKAIMGL